LRISREKQPDIAATLHVLACANRCFAATVRAKWDVTEPGKGQETSLPAAFQVDDPAPRTRVARAIVANCREMTD
jgi:hypothetical protein